MMSVGFTRGLLLGQDHLIYLPLCCFKLCLYTTFFCSYACFASPLDPVLELFTVISNPANLAQHQANLKVGPIFIAKIVPMSLGTFAISKTEKPQGGEPQSKVLIKCSL